MCKHSVLLLLIIFMLVECQSKKRSQKNVIFFHEKGAVNQKWNSIFSAKKVLHFDKSHGKLLLGRIAFDDMDHIITQTYNQHIVFFDSSGSLIRSIGRKGKGPGEFIRIKSMAFDKKDNLYVYDPSLKRLSIFKPPNYKLKQTINIKPYLADFFVDNRGNIVAYTLSINYLIAIINKKGKVILKKLTPRNTLFRINSARYQGGGVSKSKNPPGFYEIYPGKYEINYFNKNYHFKKVYKPKHINKTKFELNPPPFPSRFNPYNAHLKYWYSFLHIINIFNNRNLILVLLAKNVQKSNYKFYLNIYKKNGEVVAKGLPIPNNAMPVAVHGNKLFVWERAKVLKKDVLPQKLISYTFKDNL